MSKRKIGSFRSYVTNNRLQANQQNTSNSYPGVYAVGNTVLASPASGQMIVSNGISGVSVQNAVNSVTTTSACMTHSSTNCQHCVPTFPTLTGGAGQALTLPGGSSTPTWTTLGGAGGGAGAAGTIWTQIQQHLGGGAIQPPMTQQEEDELKMLEEQHLAETKALKKQKFRELHPELRQLVIAILMWNEKSAEISAADPGPSQRLADLRVRKAGYTISTTQPFYGGAGMTLGGGGGMWSSLSPFAPILQSILPIPTGLTVQDLQDAHTEATLEEELLSVSEESESK